MEKSIESIWKQGFLNEKSLIAPRINDLYNQKSTHVVERIKRLFRINLFIIAAMAVVFPIAAYLLNTIWQGVATSILLILTGFYSKAQMNAIKSLDHGATSLEYLKTFDKWLHDVLARSVKVARFSYPLYFLIAASIVWSAWSREEQLAVKMQQKFPDIAFVGNVPLIAVIFVCVTTVLMFLFGDRIYKWDLRLMYGRVFDKLKETIKEMEELKSA